LPAPAPWAAPLRDAMTLTLDRGSVRLLYFDPATRRFEAVDVP